MSKHRKRSTRRFGAVAAATAVVAGSAFFGIPAFAADPSKDSVPAIITDAGYEGVPFRIFDTNYNPSTGIFKGSIKLSEEDKQGFINFNGCTMIAGTNEVMDGSILISNKKEDDEEYEEDDHEKEYKFKCKIKDFQDSYVLKYSFDRKNGELPITFNPFLKNDVESVISYESRISFPQVTGCKEGDPGIYACSGNEAELEYKFEVSPDAVNFAVPIHAGANFDDYNWTVTSPGEQKPDCSSVELEKRDNGDQYLKFSCKPSLIGKQIVVSANGYYPTEIPVNIVDQPSAYVIEDGDGTQVGAGTFEKEYQGNIEVVKPAAGNSVTKVFKLWNTADKTGTPQTKTATFTFVDKEGEKPVNPGEPVKTENPGGGKGNVTPTAKPSKPAEKSSHQPALAHTGATETFGLAIGGTLMLLAGTWLVRRQRRVES